MMVTISRRLAAEFVGTAMLLAAVVGSGIMAERLAGRNSAIALLANTIATGAALFVLILMFVRVSGAHFNPAVSVAAVLAGEISVGEAVSYIAFQLVGAVMGVAAANAMFGLPFIFVSTKPRTGPEQWLGEFIATFGLIGVIVAVSRRSDANAVAAAVAAYITSAYWFTSSTSFANPAVTVARSLSDTFAGILPANVPMFVIAQFLGGTAAYFFFNWLVPKRTE